MDDKRRDERKCARDGRDRAGVHSALADAQRVDWIIRTHSERYKLEQP